MTDSLRESRVPAGDDEQGARDLVAQAVEAGLTAFLTAHADQADAAGLLNLELADLLEADFDLGLTGFTEDEVNTLMSSLDARTSPHKGEDDIPETPEEPISRPGDLWLLGHHRLLCGDSTVATVVERLLGPVTPLLMVPS